MIKLYLKKLYTNFSMATYFRFLVVYFACSFLYVFSEMFQVFNNYYILPFDEVMKFFIDIAEYVYPNLYSHIKGLSSTNPEKWFYMLIVPSFIVYFIYYLFRVLLSWLIITIDLIAYEVEKKIENKKTNKETNKDNTSN